MAVIVVPAGAVKDHPARVPRGPCTARAGVGVARPAFALFGSAGRVGRCVTPPAQPATDRRAAVAP